MMNCAGTHIIGFCELWPVVTPTKLFCCCRIAQLELVDEIEELELVLEHYVITWAIKADALCSSNKEAASEVWGLRRK
jgi:hypothetical protein